MPFRAEQRWWTLEEMPAAAGAHDGCGVSLSVRTGLPVKGN